MRKLSSFTFISLDGYYKGINEDISWHLHGEEGSKYSNAQLSEGHTLIFGRVTYEMMFHFWTSAMARENYPDVAKKMHAAGKIVFSKTLEAASWNNTKLVSKDALEEIKNLKQTPGGDLTILGSGTLVQQLAQADLIDQYKFMLDPLILGKGTPLFSGISQHLPLRLEHCRPFETGTILLEYQRVK